MSFVGKENIAFNNFTQNVHLSIVLFWNERNTHFILSVYCGVGTVFDIL